MSGMTDDQLWNSWSSSSAASILVDGQKIHDVFTAIRKQLEFLRKQHRDLCEHVETIGTTGINPNDHIQEQFNALELRLKELREVVFVNDNSAKAKITDLQTTISKLVDANKVHEKRHTENETRFTKLENLFSSQLNEVKEHILDNERGAASRDKQLTEILTQNRSDIELHKLQLFDVDVAMNKNKDIIAINEFKLKNTELKMNDTIKVVEDCKLQIKQFPAKYLDTINSSLTELYTEKADKSELHKKADLYLTEQKADTTEIERLEELANELQRQLNAQSREIQEGFSTLDGKLDAKTERIATWCLKQLKKELAKNGIFGNGEGGHGGEGGNGGNGHPGEYGRYGHNTQPRDGTDIGKIKCLVCDQVVKQQTVTDTVFGGPGMKNVIKPIHRANSPPPAERLGEREYITGTTASPFKTYRGNGVPNNNNHTNNTYTAAPRETGTTNTSPVHLLPTVSPAKPLPTMNRQHSKLVKLYSQPDINYTNDSHEDPDFIVDFKYRVSGSVVESGGKNILSITPSHNAIAANNNFVHRNNNTANQTGNTNNANNNNANTSPAFAFTDSAIAGDQSALRITSQQIMNSHLPHHNAHHTASNPLLQSNNAHTGSSNQQTGASPARYFKDLDEKFANGSTRRSASGTGSVKGNRPKSAPLKHSATTGRLYTMGKPVLSMPGGEVQ